MKKALTIISTVLFLLTTLTTVRAQDTTDLTQEDSTTETVIQTEDSELVEENTEEVREEESRELPQQVEKTRYSPVTILLAILIPCLLIGLAYLIFKFVKF